MNDAVSVKRQRTLVFTLQTSDHFFLTIHYRLNEKQLDEFFFRLNSTIDSMDPNQEITAGRRLPSISKDEWNRQTTVDARNVLQTHQSIDLTLSSNDSRTEKSTMKIFNECVLVIVQLHLS